MNFESRDEAESYDRYRTARFHEVEDELRELGIGNDPEEMKWHIVNDREEIAELKREVERLQVQEKNADFLRDELADLKAQNKVLTETISEERNSYKSGMQSIKNSITEQVSEMKSMLGEMRQTLTGSLKDVLKWRRDNGINDGAELGQIVRSASKPKQKSDYDNTPRLN